jgi:hypothetical protein
MNAYFTNPNDFLHDFNVAMEIAQKKAIYTIGIEIQKDEIASLDLYLDKLSNQKKDLSEKKFEKDANLAFCLFTLARVIQLELKMLVSLKEDRMAEAWDMLVVSQNSLATVIRNYPFEHTHLGNYLDRLSNYEKTLFPSFMFYSYGGIVEESHCSICQQDYGICDHMKGRLYNGELCCRNITKVAMEEISVVENPANKHCRTLSIETNGEKIDVLTLRKIN